ncbi:MAG: hypothetical protein QM662_11840 [Gordonia sp. (in: high G+C Gram-positive bacteria)]
MPRSGEPGTGTPPYYLPISPELAARGVVAPSRRSSWLPVILMCVVVTIAGVPLAYFSTIQISTVEVKSKLTGYYRAYATRDREAAVAVTCDTLRYKVVGWSTYRNDPIYERFNPGGSSEPTSPNGSPGLGVDEDLLEHGTGLDIVEGVSTPKIGSVTFGAGSAHVGYTLSGEPHVALANSDRGRWCIDHILTVQEYNADYR